MSTQSRRTFLAFAAAGAAAVLAGGLLAPVAVATPATGAPESAPLNVRGTLNEPGTLVALLRRGPLVSAEVRLRRCGRGGLA